MDFNDLVDECVNAINAKMKNLNTLNVVVVGKTGVGKSTLVNAVFRENLAATGIGSPVTQKMTCYTKKDMPLVIYDTKGFELGKEAQQEVKDELLQLIKDGVKSKDINKAIHCIWYCVNANSSRLEPEEEQWLRSFSEENSIYQVPVIIVITQSSNKDKAQQLKKYIEAKNLDVKRVLPVLAQDDKIADDYCVKAYGTDILVGIMQEVLPDELLDTLMSVQQANLALKKKKAQAAVLTAVASATAAGASPIPFSDAAILIPIEVTMMASITVIFGFEFNKSMLTSIVSSIIGTSGTTVAGKTIVSNLLKMIPGAGSIVGGVISGSTAALLTTALGEAYIGIMTAMYNGELKVKDIETQEGQKHLGKLFKEHLSNNKYSKESETIMSEEDENTKVLRLEYESLTTDSKQKFLKLVSKKNYRTLTEEQFWKNFTIVCDYLNLMGSGEKVSSAAIISGFYTYEYLNKRWKRFGKQHQMTYKCERFYKKVGELFPEDYFDRYNDGKSDEISVDEINNMMETYVKNILILIANKSENSSKIDINILNYSWKHFKDDIKGGLVNGRLKKPHLTERNKSLLIDMQKDKMDLPCAKDTYIYCSIALYYIKNLQERWSKNG